MVPGNWVRTTLYGQGSELSVQQSVCSKFLQITDLCFILSQTNIIIFVSPFWQAIKHLI